MFEQELEAYQGQALHFLMLNKQDNNQAQWSNLPGVLVAVGSTGGPDDLSTWAKETLTGFNPLVPYLHTKIILVDPLSADPTVISGSANFSPDSTDANDENMVVIRGNLDVADVYFTEYARIFQHFYARWWASQIADGAARPGQRVPRRGHDLADVVPDRRQQQAAPATAVRDRRRGKRGRSAAVPAAAGRRPDA